MTISNKKPTTDKSKNDTKLSLEEATNYLKKIKEWESAAKFDRETIIAWAEFLKNKGIIN